MKNNTISLSKFLSRYGNLKGDVLNKITHDDVKILFPQFKRTTFEFIRNNQELLHKGEAFLVDDGNRVIPYKVPILSRTQEKYIEVIREEDKPIIKEEIDYDYVSMSIYELKQLLDRKFNSVNVRRLAQRELNKRGLVKKKYNRNEFKRKLMEELK